MRWITCGLLCLAAWSAATATAAEFPLKDGDVWVMAGDSITAQHLHSNYFEAFCYARYPKLKFAFRNSGVGGHTIPTTLARFDYDIAAWKPTVVSVELGMNDSGGFMTDKFVENMGTMVERIRGVGARPVILAASPVNDGTRIAQLAGRNIRLSEYAVALKAFCEKEQIAYADQFHDLVDIWGANKPHELLANNIPALRVLAGNDKLAGVQQLREFLAAQDKVADKPVSLQGDPVHPGPPGQLMMAASLLKALGAEPFVSSVTLDAKQPDAAKGEGCTVSEVKAGAGGVSFDRLDATLPFPIADNARAAVPLKSDVLDLSQYTLTVKNLDGKYVVKVNGVELATLTAEQLAAGVNLTNLSTNPSNPINAQGQAVLRAVEAKEGLVSGWRGLSQRAHAPGAAPELKTQLAEATKQVEAADEKIREAAKPQKLHFELTPVK